MDDCSVILSRMFFFIDNELEEADCAEIQQHLDDCGPCLARYDLERTVKSLVARSCSEQAPAGLRQRVMLSLQQVHVEVTRRTVDRDVAASADAFEEGTIEVPVRGEEVDVEEGAGHRTQNGPPMVMVSASLSAPYGGNSHALLSPIFGCAILGIRSAIAPLGSPPGPPGRSFRRPVVVGPPSCRSWFWWTCWARTGTRPRRSPPPTGPTRRPAPEP